MSTEYKSKYNGKYWKLSPKEDSLTQSTFYIHCYHSFIGNDLLPVLVCRCIEITKGISNSIILNTSFHIAEGLIPAYYNEADEITKACFDNKLLGVVKNFNLDK